MDGFAETVLDDLPARDAALRAAFLRDRLLRRAPDPQPAADDPGIFYAEDFDLPPPVCLPDANAAPPPEQTTPPITPSDLAAAREEAYRAGHDAASADAAETRAQLSLAVLQQSADALDAARQSARDAAAAHAGDLAAATIAVLQAAIPATLATHAAFETAALARALLPLLRHEPALHIRAHPDRIPMLRDMLPELWPANGINALPDLVWNADPACAPSDLTFAWREGTFERSTQAICAAIAAALGPASPVLDKEKSHAE